MGKAGHTGIPGPLVSVARKVLTRMAVHENVQVGTNFRVGRGAVLSSPHGLHIGDNVSVGPRSIIQVDGEIGDWTIIGMGVQIVGKLDHAIDEVGVPITLSTRAAERKQNLKDIVHIGRDVWIGGSAIVLSGVNIGEGSVVGAGSVVTADVPPYSIVGGNPARFLRTRFENLDDSRQHHEELNKLSGNIHLPTDS